MNRNFLKKARALVTDNFIVFTSVYSAILILWMVCFNLSVIHFGIPDIHLFGTPPSVDQYGIISMIILGVIIAPLLETLLFQAFVFFLLSKIKIFMQYKFFILIFSSLLFSIEHIYSVQYMFYTFIAGLVLMHAYIISIGKRPSLRVFSIHAITNAVIIIIDDILGLI